MNDVNHNEVKVTLTFPRHTANGIEPYSISIPLILLYHVYKAIHEDGLDLKTVRYLALFGAGIARGGSIDPSDIEAIELYTKELTKKIVYANEVWETPEDPILSLSYHLLRQRLTTYSRAALFASDILGRPIDPDTWKQRVRRWAKRQNKEKVGLRPRQPNVTQDSVMSPSDRSS